MTNPDEYYARPYVRREIADFLRGRWVAVHCSRRLSDGRPLIVRYRGGRPLRVDSEESFARLYASLRGLGPRAFYGTANVYRRLETREDALSYVDNVVLRTPTWDIDSRPEWWRATVEVARAIADVLEREGVSRSVWVKWSGRGMHVHVNERAFSPELLSKHHPIDVSYAVVEYVIARVRRRIAEVNAKHGVSVKVENLMDPQRVFTAPLSLHRELDYCCVALKPEELDDFELEWASPEGPRHSGGWRDHETGEADGLALKALEVVGGYPRPLAGARPGRRAARVEDVSRFAPPLPIDHDLSLLRLNEEPRPLSERRDLSRGVSEVVRAVEDVVSLYALGRIGLLDALARLKALAEVDIPAQGYPRDREELAVEICRAAAAKLSELGSPEAVRKWLLSHGPPRRRGRIDEYA